MTSDATSRLRMVGYSLVLTAFAFAQQPGRMVGDTKFDLVVDPGRFLARAFTLWDPQAAFGQVQNQAYGYFWPMGPFFLAGHLAALPGWVVQRLWWSLLLVVAFVGVVQLLRALRVGTPAAQVLAGFAYALCPHVLTLLGPTSVEAWPSALAPWIVLPLVRGSEGGSARRAAALSALAVTMCGGVNAVAVAAMLPVGAIWLLTREHGPRRRALMLWWPLFTVLGTLWWSLPLLLLGKYSPPFLDYIENAPITTSTTSLPDILAGTSDWVAYANVDDWVAGHLLGTSPLLIVDAAAVVALGLAGIARWDNPHRRFLLLSVVAGAALVGFGYDGPVHGWFAGDRQALLDGVLAPFRNLHKFDAVLRLPLAIGFAHLVGVFLRADIRLVGRPVQAGVLLAAVFSVLGVAMPLYTGQVAPPASVAEVPPYWKSAAGYVARHAGEGTALVIPAAAFGDYLWGSPHDDIMQALARSPWASRNIVPLAEPGNVRMLDAVTRSLELGRPDPRLADFLASNGVGYLVVRNDLAPFRTEAPNPVVLHQALDRSPGLVRVAEFGGRVGQAPSFEDARGDRVLNDRGRQSRYPAVEVYQVRSGAGPVTAWQKDTVPVVSGGPGSRLDTDVAGAPSVLAGDAGRGGFGPEVLTDGLQRREVAFTSVRRNQSATLAADAPWRLGSVEHDHRIYPDMLRWQTVESWQGIRDATASSSTAYADAPPPLDPGRSPAAALDGDRSTSFSTASISGATGQWWRVDLERPEDLSAVRLTLGPSPVGEVRRLAVVTAQGRVDVPAPRPGVTRTVPLTPGPTTFVQVRVTRVRPDVPGAQLVLREVDLPGVTVRRFLTTPRSPFPGPPQDIVLTRDPERPACARVGDVDTCDDAWRTSSEDGDTLNRVLRLGSGAAYDAALTVRARPTRAAHSRLASALPVKVTSSGSVSKDPAASALATVDKDTATTWVADPRDQSPYLVLRWRAPVTLRSLDLQTTPGAAASAPTLVRLHAGDRSRLVRLDRSGHGTFTPMRTDHVRIEFLRSRTAYSYEGGRLVDLPVGVSEVRLPGLAPLEGLAPFTPIALGCGSGPQVTVNGTVHRTAVEAGLATLLGAAALPARLCGGDRLDLPAGPTYVEVAPSVAFVPEELHLRRPAGGGVLPTPVAVEALHWGSADRAVRLPARGTDTLLVVGENLNAGWRAALGGTSLPVQRVDGWRQGWVVPAGPAGTVRMTYTPNEAYRWSLLGGAAGVVLVALVAALRRERRPLPALGTSASLLWVDGFLLVGAGGIMAGWWGLALFLAAVLAPWRSTERDLAGWVAAAFVGAAGGVMATVRADGFVAASGLAQALACVGLAAAVVGANGPLFFSRRAGRSSTEKLNAASPTEAPTVTPNTVTK